MTETAWGALLLTILIEAPVYALFAWMLDVPWSRWALAVLGVNLLTHPVLYAAAGSIHTSPALLAAEGVVVAAEALLLRWWWSTTSSGSKPVTWLDVVLAAVAANAVSTAVGLLLA